MVPRGDQQPDSGTGQEDGELHQLLADLRRGLSDVHHLRAGLLGSQTSPLPAESKPSAVPEAEGLRADQGNVQGAQPEACRMQRTAPTASGKLGLESASHDQIAAVQSDLGSKEGAAKAGRQGQRARPTGMAKRAAAAMAAAAAGTGMELGAGHTGQGSTVQGHRWEGMQCRHSGLPLQVPPYRRRAGSTLPSKGAVCLAAGSSIAFEAKVLPSRCTRALLLSNVMSRAPSAEQIHSAHFCRKKVFRRWQAGKPQPGSADAILERQRQLAAAARELYLQQQEQARQDMLHKRQQVRSGFWWRLSSKPTGAGWPPCLTSLPIAPCLSSSASASPSAALKPAHVFVAGISIASSHCQLHATTQTDSHCSNSAHGRCQLQACAARRPAGA